MDELTKKIILELSEELTEMGFQRYEIDQERLREIAQELKRLTEA